MPLPKAAFQDDSIPINAGLHNDLRSHANGCMYHSITSPRRAGSRSARTLTFLLRRPTSRSVVAIPPAVQSDHLQCDRVYAATLLPPPPPTHRLICLPPSSSSPSPLPPPPPPSPLPAGCWTARKRGARGPACEAVQVSHEFELFVGPLLAPCLRISSAFLLPPFRSSLRVFCTFCRYKASFPPLTQQRSVAPKECKPIRATAGKRAEAACCSVVSRLACAADSTPMAFLLF